MIAILLSASLITYQAHDMRTDIDPIFVPYVNTFPVPVHYSIEFDDLKGEEIGYCMSERLLKVERHHVYIDRLAWKYASEIRRKALIWHELYHCTNGYDHDDRMQPNGCPVNIMHEYLPTDGCLEFGGTTFTIDSESPARPGN